MNSTTSDVKILQLNQWVNKKLADYNSQPRLLHVEWLLFVVFIFTGINAILSLVACAGICIRNRVLTLIWLFHGPIGLSVILFFIYFNPYAWYVWVLLFFYAYHWTDVYHFQDQTLKKTPPVDVAVVPWIVSPNESPNVCHH
jgi:hypothetical protein